MNHVFDLVLGRTGVNLDEETRPKLGPSGPSTPVSSCWWYPEQEFGVKSFPGG